MSSVTRRSAMKTLAGAAATAAVAPRLDSILSPRQGSDHLNGRERGELNRLVNQFNRQYRVPAFSVAITKQGQYVYNMAFGTADRDTAQLANITNLFRIASLTKPITSVAIFTLIEKGQLKLTDKVFGPSGVLGTKYGAPPYKQYVGDITVDNLLTHTSGGWPNDSTDPMFQHNGWDHTKLITWTIANLPLSYPPGQHWAYSNFGYCVLGRVIEAVTGQAYDDYVKASVLGPCGITDMSIAQNSEKHRAPNEVIYYGQYSEDPYKINVTRMDSHGGWIATPSDLAIFLDHVNGSGNLPPLLKPETRRIMLTPSPVYPFTPGGGAYARGWMVRNEGKGNWWHTGSLPGTTTIMVRTASGLCWAALTNTRTQPDAEITTSLDELIWKMVRSVPNWGA